MLNQRLAESGDKMSQSTQGPAPGEVTQLLAAIRQGDASSMDRLMTLVYDELRAVARRQLRRFRPGQTLDTTPRASGRGPMPSGHCAARKSSRPTRSTAPPAELPEPLLDQIVVTLKEASAVASLKAACAFQEWSVKDWLTDHLELPEVRLPAIRDR